MPKELLDLLRMIAKKENRRPKTNDFGRNRDPNLPHFMAYYNAFGSFENALAPLGSARLMITNEPIY
ncbi:homing endonuclease associated repeat-containing protein [Lederbergia citrea]|uniref:homing endonuclease associated repeat-containing protein n=1 Tax=Lederbergia citrea TaxID=2833581 RepID=UPI001BC97FD7|nr:hypothetical protein [Lederbergia citrea]MBS4202578.1 hypothetical protein [Lederbergia citrea]